MIYISLPHMYENLKFNNFLKKQVLENKQNKTILNIPFDIEMAYGSFPFSYWNGDLNNNYNKDKFPLYYDIDALFYETAIPVRLDCSNVLLEEKDLNDIHENVILNLGNNCGNYIEISSLSILNYIKEKYNNYDFILSKNADLIHPFTAEIINTFLEQNLFYLISLPDRLKNDLDTLKNINNKNKIEITIGNKCKCNDNNKILSCIMNEQNNQIKYSGLTNYNCEYINTYNNIDLLQEISFFQKLGFSHFRIDSPPYTKIKNFQLYLIQNLIQSNYFLPIYNYFLQLEEEPEI